MGISERSCQCCKFQQFAGLFINYSTCSLQVGVGYTYWPGTPLTRLKQQYTPFHKFYWGFHYVMIQEFPFHGLQVDSEDTLNRFMHSSLARTLVHYLNQNSGNVLQFDRVELRYLSNQGTCRTKVLVELQYVYRLDR